jgi:hypothetical protein
MLIISPPPSYSMSLSKIGCRSSLFNLSKCSGTPRYLKGRASTGQVKIYDIS